MAKLIVSAGTTSRLEHVFILDSTSTSGAGKTGLTNASVTMYYIRPGDGTATSVTLSAGTVGTFGGSATAGTFKEIDATNMPGLYEIGMPNNVFATTFNHSVVMIKGTGIAPVVLEYQLIASGESWIATGVWNAQVASYASAGSGETLGTDTYGTKICRTTTANRNLAVSGTQAVIINAASITSGTFAANALDAVWSTTTRTITGTGSGAITNTSFAAGAIDASAIATDAITSAELAASAIQEIWDYNISAYSTAGYAGTYLKNAGGVGNPWLTDISSAVTYPVGSTAGGDLRSAYTETIGLSTAIANMPISVWSDMIVSDSAYGDPNVPYTMLDVMALLAQSMVSVYGTVQASPAPTTTSIKTSLTGYVNSAFTDQTIVFLQPSGIAGSSTLVATSNASGTLTFDEALHQAPAVGDAFVILPIHVHSRGAIADKLLGRSLPGGADGGRTVTDALRVLRNKTSISGTTLTVKQEDDATDAWTATLSTDPTASPVTGIDPA